MAWVSMVLYSKNNYGNQNIKTKKKSCEPFRSCLLNMTANPAQFELRTTWKLFENPYLQPPQISNNLGKRESLPSLSYLKAKKAGPRGGHICKFFKDYLVTNSKALSPTTTKTKSFGRERKCIRRLGR